MNDEDVRYSVEWIARNAQVHVDEWGIRVFAWRATECWGADCFAISQFFHDDIVSQSSVYASAYIV